MGVLSEGSERVYDIEISRQQPSLQLVGRPDRSTLDLGVLRAQGVRVVGRLRELDGRIARFEDDLFATTAAADFKLAGILQRVDALIEKGGMNAEAREPFRPVWPLFRSSQTSLDLEAEGIETVIWATGYRRDYSWLDVPVLDARGEIVRSGGITGQPGLYVLGLNFLRRRNSSFIAGVGDDARELAADIASRLAIARTA
jgi:putative flavoprotein involved in K+ transport